MANNAMIAGIVIIVIIIIVAAVYFGTMKSGVASQTTTVASGGSSSPGSNKTATVPVGMTDPPSVPAGTQAVLISYSNVQVHTAGSNGGSWVNAQGSGTVNALAIVNASQTIADAQIAINSTINAVRVNVTAVKVVVNGTTSTATAPGWLSANVTSSQTVNSNSAVLMNVQADVTSQTNSTINAAAYAYTTSTANAALTTNATVSVNVGTTVNVSTITKAQLGLGV